MTNISGKLVIIGIVTVALVAAGTSWWFRYNATRRSAAFWGPEATRLIRDAPRIVFMQRRHTRVADAFQSEIEATEDVTSAPGITHLRNALLEDRSFEWPVSASPPEFDANYSLHFHRKAEGDHYDLDDVGLTIYFSPDCQWALGVNPTDSTSRVISCRPIAAGLAEMFAEFEQSDASAR